MDADHLFGAAAGDDRLRKAQLHSLARSETRNDRREHADGREHRAEDPAGGGAGLARGGEPARSRRDAAAGPRRLALGGERPGSVRRSADRPVEPRPGRVPGILEDRHRASAHAAARPSRGRVGVPGAAGQCRARAGRQPVWLADRFLRRRGRQRRADQGGRRSQPEPADGTVDDPLQEPPAAPLQRNDAQPVRRPARRARARRVRPLHDERADDALVHAPGRDPITLIRTGPAHPAGRTAEQLHGRLGLRHRRVRPRVHGGHDEQPGRRLQPVRHDVRPPGLRTGARRDPGAPPAGPARLGRARALVRRTAGPGRHVRPGKRDRDDRRRRRPGSRPVRGPARAHLSDRPTCRRGSQHPARPSACRSSCPRAAVRSTSATWSSGRRCGSTRKHPR